MTARKQKGAPAGQDGDALDAEPGNGMASRTDSDYSPMTSRIWKCLTN